METNEIDCIVYARDVMRAGVAAKTLRRIGNQLFPDGADWYNLDRASCLSPEAGLGVMIAQHLIDKRVLIESDAISVLLFFKDNVTRYAKELLDGIEKYRDNPSGRLNLPFSVLEVSDGRWARFTREQKMFDIAEQQAAQPEDTESLLVYSHAVCVTPLFLQICPVERSTDADNKLQDELEECAGE